MENEPQVLSVNEDGPSGPVSPANESESLEERVYVAARDGLTVSLYAILGERDAADQKRLLEVKTLHEGHGITPLMVAAKSGHAKIVQLLVSKFCPDLEATCTVNFDGVIIEGATALWVACGAGHLEVAKVLVKAGAEINHLTKIHSTPLRAACFNGNHLIVEFMCDAGADPNIANQFNNTCLMIAAYKGHLKVVKHLLKRGVDPNVTANCGATSLHFSAELGHLEIVEELMKNGATMTKNNNGMTPLISGAERCQAEIIEYITSRPEVTVHERIDAFELLGASFANDKEHYNLDEAHKYLLAGMNERWRDPGNVIAKPILPPVPAYESRVECETLEDLVALRSDPNSLHMEGLVIRERILGTANPEVPHPVIFRGAVFADDARFDRCIQLWLHSLRLRKGLEAGKANVSMDLLRFAQVFSEIIHVGLELDFENLIEVISAVKDEIAKNPHSTPCASGHSCSEANDTERNLTTLLYLLVIYSKIQKKVSKEDHFRLMKVLYDAVALKPRTLSGATLLHLAVNSKTPVDDFYTSSVVHFPCAATTKLLIEAGTDVGATDATKDTPLHKIVSYNKIVSDFLTLHAIITALVEAGAHIDVVNAQGLTPMQCATTGVAEIILKSQARLTLKCLAAQSVKRHNLTYQGQVPESLVTFIEMHGP